MFETTSLASVHTLDVDPIKGMNLHSDTTKKPTKVLVVDDLRANRVLLRSVMKSFEVEVHEAANGKEALVEVEQHDFALILMDVQMPIMDGFEATRILNESELTKYIPIIFLTADASDERHIAEGYQAGAVDYLFKPFNKDILSHKIRIFIELHREKKRVQEIMGKLALEIADRERAEKEQARLKKELSKRQEMEMAGKIASGVAHGIQEIIGSLDQDIEVLLDNTPEEHENFERLKRVQTLVKRAFSYVRGLLVVGREGDKAKAENEALSVSK